MWKNVHERLLCAATAEIVDDVDDIDLSDARSA
jgi:hypothetical protein